MSGERLWWLALAAVAATIALAVATGPSRLTTGAAFVAFALVVLAVVVEGPPAGDRRRPW